MPCFDPYADELAKKEDDAKRRKEKAFLEAALCGVLKAFERRIQEDGIVNPLDLVNYHDSGIEKRDLQKWYKDHQEKDAKKN